MENSQCENGSYLFCYKIYFSDDPHCQFISQRYEADLTESGILYFKFNRIDTIKKVTKLKIV